MCSNKLQYSCFSQALLGFHTDFFGTYMLYPPFPPNIRFHYILRSYFSLSPFSFPILEEQRTFRQTHIEKGNVTMIRTQERATSR